jgi:TP901 family phage tail tape measure protein
MADIGTAFIRILPDTASLNARMGAYFSSSQWSKMGKAAGVAVGAGIAAGGAAKALYEIGEAFDDAYDTIRVKTGATGKEMRKLEQSFRDVVGTVPVDFETASTAVANLGQRLDQTGKPLTRLAKQMSALSKVTGTDIQENIEATTRLFGDWSIRTSKQSETLDKLFRLTHETGIEFSELSRLMVQFGSPLRQLGFRFDEAAVMFARFEREGVNMQTLLPGLRFALKNILVPSDDLAKSFEQLGISTKDPREALFEIFEILEKDKIKEADQTVLASSVFGGRAWADMKAAVEEGRFEFEDLMKTIRDGDVTIRGSERSTRDFAEQWMLFKNNVMLALEPIARDVFRALSDGMKDVQKAFRAGGVGAAFDVLLTKAEDAFEALVSIAAEAAPKIVGSLASGLAQAWREASPLAKLFTAAGVIRLVGGKGAVLRAGMALGGVLGGGITAGAAGGAAGGAATGGLLGTLRGKLLPIAKRVGLAGVGLTLADSVVSEFGRRAAMKSDDMWEALEAARGPGTIFGVDWAEDLSDIGGPLSGMLSDSEKAARDLVDELRAIEEAGGQISGAKVDEMRRALAKVPDIGDDAREAVDEFLISANRGATRAGAVLKSKLNLDEIEHGWSKNMREMAGISGKELDRIGDLLRDKPRKGVEAFDKAMGRMVASIRKAMKQGRIETDKGQAMIHSLLIKQLQNYGISHGGAQKILKAKEGDSQGGFATGGLAGIVPGRGSGDRHTLSLDGRPIAKVESREGIFVGNRSMMAAAAAANAQIPRRARGGMVDPAGPGTGVVNPAIAKVVGAWSKRYDAAINYGYDPGGGHQSPGHNVTGTATDTGPAAGWTTAATALFERGLKSIIGKVDQVIYGTAGIGMPLSNHGRGNHAHIEWGMHPAVQAALKMKLPRFTSPWNVFKPSARGLNQQARALEKIIPRRAGAGGGGDIGPQGGGIFSKSQLASLWSATGRNGDPNLMAAIALAESGGNPNVTNSIGARGLWQIIPSTAAAYGLPYGRLTDPTLNARGAHQILAGQGLGAWEAYTRGMHTQYLARGGIAKLATGGIPGAPPGFELGKFGSAHMKKAQIPGLRKRLGRILRRIARIDEQIDVAGREAQLTSSPGGAELTEAEIAGQIKLNLRLRDRLRDALGVAKIGERLGKRFGGKGAATPFRDARLEIAGITGTGGRLLDVREALDALRATEASGAIPGQMDIATFQAFAEAIRLGAFKRGGAVLNFGGGGVVPGPIGRPQAAIVHGGERVSSGRTLFTITNWETGSGYFEDIAEDRIAVAERSAYMEDATR